MVYFTIIMFYCTLFTVGAYMFIKRLRDIELQHLRDKHDQQIEELRSELVNIIRQLDDRQQLNSKTQINDYYSRLEDDLNIKFGEVREALSNQTESYLSQMSNRVSSTMEEIKQDVKKKPVI